jgi:hypothetical protein
LIARYLLGDLSETESAQLEDSSFSNPEQLEELRSVENDLIDEYARGELPSGEREKFERLFFANPERRQKVEFAMALARVSCDQVPSASIISREGTGTFRDFFSSLFRVRRQALIYATSALAVGVLIGVWWLFARTNSRNDQIVRRPSGQEQVTPGKGTPGPSPEATTQSQPPEIVREGSSPPASNQGAPHDNRNAGRGISHAEPTVATFVLLPGVSRSSGERTKLVIPRGRRIMRLKLELEEHDTMSYRSFAAELSRANSQRLWASGNLSIQKNRTLILNIPISVLPAETPDYELILRGRAVSGGAFETIGYYSLAVVKE